jgi:purine-binding chemotaxis protein CheW
MTASMQMNTRDPGTLATSVKGERNQFLTFTLRNEVFAMDIRSIREVIQYGGITEVPLMPPTVRGVINLRGSVVPVIDLAARFGWSLTDISRRTCIVILEIVQDELPSVLGIMVDHVSEVLDIAPEEIEPAPAFGSRLRSDFIHGVGKVGGKFVIILKVDQVLSIEELGASGFDAGQESFGNPNSGGLS